MTISVTPIFIPGLILTRDIFAAQINGLVHPAAAKTADTLGRDSITAMAEAALALAKDSFKESELVLPSTAASTRERSEL